MASFCCPNRHLHPFLFFSSISLLFCSVPASSLLPLTQLSLWASFAFHHCCRWLTLPMETWEFSPRDRLAQVVPVTPVWPGLPHQASGTLWVCTPPGCLVAPCWCPRDCWMGSWRQEQATLDGCTPMAAGSGEALRKMIPPPKRALSSWRLACSVSTEAC